MNALLTHLGIVLGVIFVGMMIGYIVWSILRYSWGIVGLLTGHGTSFFPKRKEGGEDNDGDSDGGDSGGDGGGASGHF
jgi:hypothetical protein